MEPRLPLKEEGLQPRPESDTQGWSLLSRPGLLAILALAVGHVFAAALRVAAWEPGFIILTGSLAILLWLRKSPLLAAIAVCAAIAGLGAVQESILIRRDSDAMVIARGFMAGGYPLAAADGVVDQVPRRTQEYWTLQLRPRSQLGIRGSTAEFPGAIAVRVRQSPAANELLSDLVPGDRLLARGTLQSLPSRFSPEEQHWLARSGSHAVLRAEAVEMLSSPEERTWWGSFQYEAHSIANDIEDLMRHNLPPRQAAVLVSMTLGRTHLLGEDQRLQYRRTGLLHLFAVSGLHTMLVGGLMLLLLRAMGLRPGWRLPLLTILLLFFAALEGMRPSVIRAAVLLIIMDGRNVLGRPVEPIGALGALATVMAVLSPRLIWQVDFQMTFLCVGTLMMMAPWMIELRKLIGRRLGWGPVAWVSTRATQLLCYSAVIQLVLSPVMLDSFGEVSLVAPAANLVVLPLATMVVIPGAFIALILYLAVPVVGETLLQGLEFPITAMDAIARHLASIPFSSLENGPLPLLLAAALYLALLGGGWNHERREVHPRRPAWSFAPGFLAVTAVLVWAPAQWEEPATDIWFIDVGQGDATLLRFPDGATMLVDAGSEMAGPQLVGFLKRRGITHLDAVVASHADGDHIGGMAGVLDSIPAGTLFVGGSIAGTEGFERLQSVVKDRSTPVVTLRRGAQLEVGEGNEAIQVLHPTDDFLLEGDERNDASVVLRIPLGGETLLLAGDAEADAELSMLDSGVDVRSTILKVGHHGADTSSSEQFLQQIAAKTAIISCGRLNRYGHPHPELLKRLQSLAMETWRTDSDGTIHLQVLQDGSVVWTSSRGAFTAIE
jgi:competence protein ComEC